MPGALEGVKVLDLSRVLVGPFCSMMLADIGAGVFKQDSPFAMSWAAGGRCFPADCPAWRLMLYWRRSGNHMDTFFVRASLASPQHPEQRLALDLLVDTGATWTMLPQEVVTQLGLSAPRKRAVTLASGERVTYAAGQVAIQLNGEDVITVFLAGPPGSLALLGAVALEEFGLAPDPVRKTLLPVAGLLA